MKRQIFNSTLLGILGTAIGLAMSFCMTPILLHRMGQDQYGVYIFIGIFFTSGYFSLLDMGMQGTAVKYIAEYMAIGDIDSLSKVVNTVILFFLLAGLVGAILLLTINHLLLEHIFNIPTNYLNIVKLLVDFIAVSFLFQFPLMGLSAVIEGVQRFDILRIPPMMIAIISNVLIFFYLKFDLGIVFLTFTSLFGSFILFSIYFFSIKIILPAVKINPIKFSKEVYKKLFNMSYKLLLSRIVGLIFNNTDKIIISIVLTSNAMTNYDLINKINMIVMTLASLVNSSLVSFTSKFSGANEKNKIKVLLVKGTKYSILITLPALIFFMIFSGNFIFAWVGGGYSGLQYMTMLFISSSFFTVLTGVGFTMLVGVNKVDKILKISILMAVVNILVSTATVKRMGITGLIMGTVLACILSVIMYIPLITKTFHITIWNFINEAASKAYILAFFISMALIIIKNTLVVNTIPTLFLIGSTTYLLYFSLYFLWDTEERKTLLELFFRIKNNAVNK